MAVLTCPACNSSWETFATSYSTRCGQCGTHVYVATHLRRLAPDPYLVSCPCGNRWWSTSASGRTRCRRCGGRVYLRAADRGRLDQLDDTRRQLPDVSLPILPGRWSLRQHGRPLRLPRLRSLRTLSRVSLPR